MMDISAEKASMDDAKRNATTPMVMAHHRPSQLSDTLHLCPHVNAQQGVPPVHIACLGNLTGRHIFAAQRCVLQLMGVEFRNQHTNHWLMSGSHLCIAPTNLLHVLTSLSTAFPSTIEAIRRPISTC